MRLIKENSTSPEEIVVVNQRLGDKTARAIQQSTKEQEFSPAEDVDLIAGQRTAYSFAILS